MKKIALGLIGIIAELFAFSNTLHSSQVQRKKISKIKYKKRYVNNGERWFHVLPEFGESYLGIALFQFEIERAKALATA